ncbi:MAG TPA: hypothetical protein VL403_19585, partial [Candidatus Kryptonia bacterium]|nr:hypothetical protein [Candidatus Kryptonia bacterium]
TATPLRCGNGLLESGELCTMCVPDDQSCCHTCDVCPADCEVKSCSAAAPTHTVAVSFAAPTSQDVTGLTIVLGYRSDVVSLPGTGADSSASARVKNRPSNTIFSAFDLDYALRAVLSRSNAFKPGQIFTVDFDGCSGSAAPTVADFGCSVVGCANSFGDVDGCSCSVSLE